MNQKDKVDISCDTETGICSPSENFKMETKSEEEEKEDSKLRLVYYYDALCGWCFGFSSTIKKVAEEYSGRIEIKVVSGGLFLGNRAGKVNQVAPHIKAGAYRSVEARTGVKFGESFLNDVFGDGKMTLNSLPPTIALCIVKEKFPTKELKFAELLLKAVYFDGLNPIDVDGLAKYAAKIGFKEEEFKLKMKDSKYQNLAEKEFETFHKSQFRGMPALVLDTNGGQHLISNGYVSFEEIRPKLESHLDSK